MTTIMNQVTCSLCNIKTDELQWMDHLISSNHLQLFKNHKDKIAINFYEKIFSTNSQKNQIYSEKKTFHVWKS